MTPGGGLLIALFLQSVSGTPVAAPETLTTRARLDLRSAADCISRGDLASRVRARSPRIQFVDDAAIFAHVVVTLVRPGNVVAEIALATPGAEQPSRRFAAHSCAEAANAIALIIAVTLDPTLKPTGGDEAPPTDKPADQPSAAIVESPRPPAVVGAVAPPAPVAARRHFGVSVAAQTIFGPAPAVMPGIAISGMAALDRGGVWSPAIFVGAMHVWRSDLAETGGTASFTLDAATVDVCPLRVGGSGVVARPCASALVGRLNASGADTQQGASAVRPFATAGAAVSAAVGTTVEISARVGVGVTLLRDAYEFGGATFHRASAITTSASLGIGLHWP
jgi:hypothetical protein